MTEIKLGYARVSTYNQRTDNQVEKLQTAGCSELFIEEPTSGTKNSTAPQFLALMSRVAELRSEGKHVLVCVTKLDRFSRSLKDLLEAVEALGKMGASFTAIDDSFTYDASSPMSKLMLQMLGALAEFERSLIQSRMDEGLAAATAKGLRRGAKPSLTKAQVKTIKAEHEAGASATEIANEWGLSKSLIGRVLGLYPSKPPYVTLDEWEQARKQSRTRDQHALGPI
ncbi:MAG: recombinase family protein [Leucobacter sp.]